MAVISNPLENTPSALLHDNPCLACLSEHELLAVIALALAQANETYAGDVAALLKASACYTCIADKQLLQGAAAVISNVAFGSLTVAEIRDRIKCLVCANPKQLKAAILFMLADSYQIEV